MWTKTKIKVTVQVGDKEPETFDMTAGMMCNIRVLLETGLFGSTIGEVVERLIGMGVPTEYVTRFQTGWHRQGVEQFFESLRLGDGD